MASDRDRNEHGQYADRIPAEAALEAFDEREDMGRPLTATDVMESLGCSRRTAHNKLDELVDEGAIETRKIGARGRVWWVPIEAESTRGESAGRADVESEQPATAQADTEADHPPAALREAVEAVDLPGSGPTLEARREALLASYRYLVDNPGARKSDFVENVYPDYPAAFETEEGWWNAIQPALKELPAVDSPEERGHIWTFLGGDRFTPTLG